MLTAVKEINPHF